MTLRILLAIVAIISLRKELDKDFFITVASLDSLSKLILNLILKEGLSGFYRNA